MKFSPIRIIRAHRQTYSDARTGRVMPSDIIGFEIVPALVGLISAALYVQLNPVAAAALLMVTGLIGALLFGAMLQASQRAYAGLGPFGACAIGGNIASRNVYGPACCQRRLCLTCLHRRSDLILLRDGRDGLGIGVGICREPRHQRSSSARPLDGDASCLCTDRRAS